MDIKSLTRANTAAIPTIQMLATGAVLGTLISGHDWWMWLIPLGVFFCTGCLGVTMTYHRLLTHRGFELWKPLEYLFSLFGALGGTGSSIGWVSVHKAHHRFSDTPDDPHSPVHRGWEVLLGSYQHEFDKWAVRDLISDRFHRFLHDYYFLILVVWAAILLWFSFAAFTFVFVIPMAIQLWVSNLSNYFNHMHGYRNFDTPDNSRNTWWIALLAWGEGWHNNHHRFPWRSNFGYHWWEFDITYWMIRLFGYNIRETSLENYNNR